MHCGKKWWIREFVAPIYISFKSWLCCCSLPAVALQQKQHLTLHFTSILFSYQKHNLSWRDGNGDLSTCEDIMLFTRVFAQKLTWYFIDVYCQRAASQRHEAARRQPNTAVRDCSRGRKISNWCNSHNGNVRIQRKKNKECIVFGGTRDKERRIHKPFACLWVPCLSCLQPIVGWKNLFASYGHGCTFARWNFLLPDKEPTVNFEITATYRLLYVSARQSDWTIEGRIAFEWKQKKEQN